MKQTGCPVLPRRLGGGGPWSGGSPFFRAAELRLDVFENFRYTDELMGDGVGFLVGRAKVDGLEIEFVDHLRFDGDGRIADITVFFQAIACYRGSAATDRREVLGRPAERALCAAR